MNKFKTSKAKLLLALAVLMVSVSCEDISVTTTVLPDGTCQRMIVVKSSSEDIFKGVFPIPVDASWTITEKKETDNKQLFNKSNYIYTAQKSFRNIQELNEEFSHPADLEYKLAPLVNCEKKVTGLYTLVSYREVYPVFSLFKTIPATDYFSAGEMEIIKQSLRDDKQLEENLPENQKTELEKKMTEWISRCVFEEFFKILLKEAENLNDPELKPGSMRSRKEQLFTSMAEVFEVSEDVPVEEMLKKSAEILQAPALTSLWQLSQPAFKNYEKKVQATLDVLGDEYTIKVILPGEITSTNAETVTDNSATWKIMPILLYLEDYEMFVESRLVNHNYSQQPSRNTNKVRF